MKIIISFSFSNPNLLIQKNFAALLEAPQVTAVIELAELLCCTVACIDNPSVTFENAATINRNMRHTLLTDANSP